MSNKTGRQDPLHTVAGAQFAHALKLEPHSAKELQSELEIHQIELEMQNEQLRQTQLALEESRDRYADLYEFAPVGYFTLNHEGMINEINLTGATLLGVERSKLLHRRFAHFIAHEDLDSWRRHFLNVLTRDDTVTCEVALQHGDGSRFYARLDCLRISETGKIPVLRVSLADITEHKRAESMLRESEEKFRAIFEGTLDGVLLADAKSRRLTTGNPAICRMLGYSHEELTRLSVSDIHPPQGLQHVIEQFEGQLRGEIQLSTDLPVKRRDGSVFYADIKSSAVNFGDKTYLLGVFRDITERKQAENELRKLSLAVEQSPNSIIITDLDANIEYVNTAFVKATGYSRKEVIGQNPRILHSGKNSRETYDDMWDHLARGEIWKGEFINRRKDGSEYIESIFVSPVRDADGRITHYLAIKEDITQFMQAHEALRVSRENLYRLLNSMAEGAYGVDTNGDCTFVNQAFLQILGYQNENEVLGKHTHELMHHSHADGSPCPDSECNAYRAYRTNHLTNVSNEVFWRRDGIAIPVEYWSHPIVSDGTVTGAIITFIDITERKQSEAQLAAQYEHVKKMNARLVETNQQLEQAQNQLLQSEKMAAIGLLAAGVAHEINNPVGYVNSNIGTLEKYLAHFFFIMDKYAAAEALMVADNPLLQELREFKAKINLDRIRQDTKSLIAESQQGLERVKKIILDLKEFSHADSEDQWVWTDVHHILDTTLNVVWNELKYKCEVVKEYGTLPNIYCLPSQLNQVFMNLLVNAGQAIEARGTITLRTGQQADMIWVEVLDTGKGIQPENIPRLFEPFFTTKPVGQGTGLGLSVSYTIMEKHHGKIEVHSKVGKGSSFRVWLPVQQPDTKETT